MKKRVAIFMHGGISGGLFSQGFPMIVQVVNRLAEEFDLTVYSVASGAKDFSPDNFKFVTPASYIRSGVLRWLSTVLLFARHQFQRPHQTLFSFWGYPTGFLVVAFGKIFRRPSIVIILGAETANVPKINYGHLRDPFRRRLVLWTCRKASELIAVSTTQIQTLARHGIRREIHLIPLGCDPKKFYPSPKSLQTPLKILHVANLNPVKDQVTLLKAFSIIKDKIPARLRIVGPDYLHGEIHRAAGELGLKDEVEFTGPIAHTEILSHYHWADAFMLTSLSEGQNVSITEAMMCGLLPVSTAVGHMDSEFGNRVGIAVDCGDFEALGNRVVKLYSEKTAWEKKRDSAYKWATEHDLNWSVQSIRQVLNKTLNPPK